jgi:hypothetical protein
MIALFTHPDDNATATLIALVRRLRARVTAATVRTTLQRHPDYPSLLSLSDTLNSWQINNMAVQLPTTGQLQEVPMPFVAHLNTKGGWYVLVTGIDAETLTYVDSADGVVNESMTAFVRKWSGTVLMAEVSETSGEADYVRNRRIEHLQTARGLGLLVGFVLLAGFAFWPMRLITNPLVWGLCLTKTLGVVVGLLLLVHQFNRQNLSRSQADRLAELVRSWLFLLCGRSAGPIDYCWQPRNVDAAGWFGGTILALRYIFACLSGPCSQIVVCALPECAGLVCG